jgi:hypothetical protein
MHDWVFRNWFWNDNREGGLNKENILFLKKLFGRNERGKARMDESMWQGKGKLRLEQKERLAKPFTIEVEYALKDMKTERAPELDGFPIVLCKKVWGFWNGGPCRWWRISIMEN